MIKFLLLLIFLYPLFSPAQSNFYIDITFNVKEGDPLVVYENESSKKVHG